MILIKLAKALVVFVEHVDKMVFGKFHSCNSSPLHPCRESVSKTAVIFTGLFCPYQDVHLKEWYVPTATHHNTVLGYSVVELPYHWNNDVVGFTIYATTHLPSGLVDITFLFFSNVTSIKFLPAAGV